jgi:hypothetical protein
MAHPLSYTNMYRPHHDDASYFHGKNNNLMLSLLQKHAYRLALHLIFGNNLHDHAQVHKDMQDTATIIA